MNRAIVIKKTMLLACATLIAGTLLSLKLARDQSARAQGGGGEGFGDQVAGAYVLDVKFPSSPAFRALLNVALDGTFQVSSEFRAGNLESGIFSMEHGVWQPLGANRVATTSIIFTFDSNGRHTDTHRVRSTSTLSKLEDGVFQELAGIATVDIYSAGQNPIIDEPVVLDANQGTLTGKRLNVE